MRHIINTYSAATYIIPPRPILRKYFSNVQLFRKDQSESLSSQERIAKQCQRADLLDPTPPCSASLFLPDQNRCRRCHFWFAENQRSSRSKPSTTWWRIEQRSHDAGTPCKGPPYPQSEDHEQPGAAVSEFLCRPVNMSFGKLVSDTLLQSREELRARAAELNK